MKGIIDIRIDRADGEVVEFRLYNDIVQGVFTNLRDKAHPSTGKDASYSTNYVPKRIKVDMSGSASYTSADLTPSSIDQALQFKISGIAGSAFSPALTGNTLSRVSLIAGAAVATTEVAFATNTDTANYTSGSSSSLSASVGASDTITVTYTLNFYTAATPPAAIEGVVQPALNYVNKIRDLVETGGADPDISLSSFQLLTAAGVQITTGTASNITTSTAAYAPFDRSAYLTLDVTFDSVQSSPGTFQVWDADENILYSTVISDEISGWDNGDTVLIDDFEFVFGQTDAT
jgi:hypothetical protein